jgi:hypothetical protein
MTTRILANPTSLGNVILRAHYDAGGQPESVEVLEAAPRVLINGQMLREMHAGQPAGYLPFATVDKPETGGVLRIHATNGILVYRITEYEPLVDGWRGPDTYVGEWPD